MGQISKEFTEAVKAEMERQGYEAINNGTAAQKGKSLLNAVDFLLGGNLRELEAYKQEYLYKAQQVYSTRYHEMRNLDDEKRKTIEYVEEVKNSLKELEETAKNIQVEEIKFPESIEGRILAIHKEMLANLIANEVSPDVAARCTSYTLWAYLGCDDKAITQIEI